MVEGGGHSVTLQHKFGRRVVCSRDASQSVVLDGIELPELLVRGSAPYFACILETGANVCFVEVKEGFTIVGPVLVENYSEGVYFLGACGSS